MNKFDKIVANKIKKHASPVDDTLWDKVEDSIFPTKIDRILSAKLKDYPSEVSDKVWIGIERELFPTKRNAYVVYGLIGFLALVCMGGLAWHVISDTSPIAVAEVAQVADTEIVSNQRSQNDFKNTASSAEDNYSKSLNINRLETDNTNSKKIQPKETEQILLDQTDTEEAVATSTFPLSESTGTDRNSQRFIPSMDNKIDQTTRNSNPDRVILSQNGDIESGSSINQTPLTGSLGSTTLDRSEATLLPLGLIGPRLISAATPQINPKINIIHKSKPAFSFDIFAGLDAPMQNLQVANPDENGILIARESREVDYLSWNMGLRFSYYPSRRVAIRTGLFINQYNVKFNYEDINATREQILIQGQDTFVYVVNGQREVQHLNHYRSYSIPLQLGIIASKGPFTLSVNPGILVNINSSVEGRNIDQSNHVFEIDDSNLYKNNFGISFFGSVDIGYALSSRLDFYLEPNLRYHIGNINLSEVAVSERFTSFGVLSGFRYHF